MDELTMRFAQMGARAWELKWTIVQVWCACAVIAILHDMAEDRYGETRAWKWFWKMPRDSDVAIGLVIAILAVAVVWLSVGLT